MSSIQNQIQELINKGRFIEAVKKSYLGSDTETSDQRLIQLRALALSKSGTPEDAARALEPTYQANPEDSETAGILAGIYKNVFMKNQDPDFGMKSYQTYLNNYEATKSYYTGINAATMSALIGMAGKGRKIADEILPTLDVSDFWQLATRAEAYLLKKEYDKALDDYLDVRKQAGNDWGKIGSIRAQLWLLNHYTKVPENIRSLFKAPIIASFVGHMIDHPERGSQRFPAEIEPEVREAIRTTIRNIGVNIGFCSLACGSDILFAEAMIEEDREIGLILPFMNEDFLETSVSFAGDDWTERFNRIIESRNIRYITTGPHPGYDSIFQLLGKSIMGASLIRAQINDTTPQLITVLSSFDLENRLGGTRDMLQFWPFPENHQNIDIDSIRTRKIPDTGVRAVTETSTEPDLDDTTKHMMYCSMENCSDDEINIVLEKIDLIRNELITPLDHYSYGDDIITLIHSSVAPIMEIAEIFSQTVRSPFTMIFHTDLISDVSNMNSSDSMKFVSELTDSKSTERMMMATGNFSCQLALESSNYIFKYAGIVHIDESNEMDIFRLIKK